VLVELQFILVG